MRIDVFLWNLDLPPPNNLCDNVTLTVYLDSYEPKLNAIINSTRLHPYPDYSICRFMFIYEDIEKILN